MTVIFYDPYQNPRYNHNWFKYSANVIVWQSNAKIWDSLEQNQVSIFVCLYKA